MGNSKEGREFYNFINELRVKKGYTLRQLCEGLCSHGTVEAMENGCWEPDKFLQDSILERLGVAAEDYVHGLDYVDYGRWVARLRILHSITFCQPEQAEKLLVGYEKDYDISRKYERQFLLAMKAQVKRCQGSLDEELFSIFREAVELTVPGWERKTLKDQALSVKELNLILEAEHCRKEGERIWRYREIVDYITHSGFDGVGMAKIYPKAVYFLCRSIEQMGDAEGRETGMMLKNSGYAIEILRKHKRMYYLWELVKLREKLADVRAEELNYRGECEKSSVMRNLSQEMETWRQVLEKVYAEQGVPRETFEFCYLYVMKGGYCINDAILNRRKALGISQCALCQGICNQKTLRRVGNGKTRPNRVIAERLMERLGLPGALTRTELVTESQEAREQMEELRRLLNMGLWEEANQVWQRIRERVSVDIRCNQQTLLNSKVLLKWHLGEIGKQEYLSQMQGVLELTLPYLVFLKGGKMYVTNMEQCCVLNRMEAMEKESDEYLACMERLEEMNRFYIDRGIWEGEWNMYEFAMYNVGSDWANRGEYDKSDYYNQIILEGCLRFRRMALIPKCIYGRWWNYDMRKQKGIPVEKAMDDEEELLKCIQFSIMIKNKGGNPMRTVVSSILF